MSNSANLGNIHVIQSKCKKADVRNGIRFIMQIEQSFPFLTRCSFADKGGDLLLINKVMLCRL